MHTVTYEKSNLKYHKYVLHRDERPCKKRNTALHGCFNCYSGETGLNSEHYSLRSIKPVKLMPDGLNSLEIQTAALNISSHLLQVLVTRAHILQHSQLS